MAPTKSRLLSLDDVTIPPQRLEANKHFMFIPSKITDLVDATSNDKTPPSQRASYYDLPKLDAVAYKRVKIIGMNVESEGIGSWFCLYKNDFEDLKKRCMLKPNNTRMVGQAVTAVYVDHRIKGFIAPYTNPQDLK